MANVKDLLIRMSLDTSKFATNIANAKRELNTLKAEYNSITTDPSAKGIGDALLENLRAQKQQVENEIKGIQAKLESVQNLLAEQPSGSAKERALVGQVQTLEKDLANAETHLNQITTRLQNFKSEQFTQFLQDMAGGLRSLDIAYSELFGWTGDATNNADAVFSSREDAWTGVTKILRDRAGYTEEWGQALNDWNREVIQRIPVSYEALAEIEANALQAGGVSMEGLRQFTEMYAKLQSATNLDGEAGAQQFGKFLTVMNASEEEYDRLGSVVVALGNNYATLEDQIVATAKRAASSLRAGGFSPEDALAMSAAATAMGMEEAAAATSMEKVTGKMAKAAALARGEYQALLQEVQSRSSQWNTVYDMLVEDTTADTGRGELVRSLAWQYHMTVGDMEKMLNNAVALEKFSEAMGVSAQTFGQLWNADAARTFIDFFANMGRMDEAGSESLLTALDYLGITEVRAARLARNFAMNGDTVAAALNIARDAYEENVALDNEAAERFATNTSRRIMNANKAENMAEAMGQQVISMRAPWEDFFGDLQQWFADWPAWAQDAVSSATEILNVGGQAISAAADTAFAFNQLNTAYRQIKGMDTSRLTAGLATAGKVGLGLAAGAGIAYGLYELVTYLDRMNTDVTEISETLSTLTIEIDEESKNAALRTLSEVKNAAYALGGGDSEEARQNAELAKMGFGTLSMFGSGVGWQIAVRNQLAEDTMQAYYREMGELGQAQRDAATDAERAALQNSMKERTAQMEKDLARIADDYTREINAMANGMLGSAAGEEQHARLQRITQLYNALAQFSAWNGDSLELVDLRSAARELEEAYGNIFTFHMGDYSASNWVPQNEIKALYGNLAAELSALSGDENIMTLLGLLTDSGALAGVDPTELDGALLALIQAMDIKAVGDSGAQNTQDVGKALTDGLARGLLDGQATATAAAQDLATAVENMLRTALQVHSPSALTQAMGQGLAQGLALGIAQNSGLAVDAMRALGAQVAAEARSQAALIENALPMIAPIPAAAPASNTYNQSRTVSNTFHIAAGTPQQQQNIRTLARELTAMQAKADRALGN